VQRAADRFRVEHDGITSWHSFSAGAHYDPDNVAFGPLLACDEHVLAPGASFPAHRHARVELVSWVLAGVLRHEDASGRVALVRPGQVQHQLAGRGIEHVERNASDCEPLRFVQLWLLCDADEPAYELTAPPARLATATATLTVHHEGQLTTTPDAHLFVCAGTYSAAGAQLYAGDSVRATERLEVTGTGELLVIMHPAPS
ncbi:MAG TPA: pirin family protein, partial [Jatrophihabitans sp.]|nr:pirin family protein [Jatrophihabitans sp.]